MPEGLSINNFGAITGTPTKPGKYSFSVTLTNEAGSTVTIAQITEAGYTIELKDSDTTAFNGNEYFAYYENKAFGATETAASATIDGTIGTEKAQKVVTKDAAATYSINGTAITATGAVIDGATYQLGTVDASGNQTFVETIGEGGKTTAIEKSELELVRTISGSKIAGTEIVIIESGTSATVTLQDVTTTDGTSILSEDKKSVTIGSVK